MSYKLKKYFILSLFLFLFFPISVYAETEITLTSDKKTLEIGDEITITAKFTGEVDLYAFMAKLSYDESVFESITTSDFTLANDTLDISYNRGTNKFGILNKTGSISRELFKINLKVKDNAQVGSTNIALTNISSSDGESKTVYAKKVISVLVTKDAADGETITPNKPNEIIEESESLLKVFTTKPILTFLGIWAIGTAILLLVICLFKKDSLTLKKILTGLLVIEVGAFIVLAIINDEKKDVNHDGDRTYEDAKDILEYLLDIEGTKPETPSSDDETSSKPNTNPSSSNKPSNNKPSSNPNNNDNSKPATKPDSDYDVNNDGKVDIDDVGSSTKDTTKKTHYTVSLSELSDENIYIARGLVTLNFKADVKPYETIQEVMVDGIYYPVVKSDDYYSVTVPTPEDIGSHKFIFSKIKLANHREIDNNFTIEKIILKDLPYVDLFTLDDQTKTLSFKLEDVDDAFTQGEIIIIDDDDKKILESEITKDNTFKLENINEDQTYTILIYASYNLNSMDDNSANIYENSLIYEHSFRLASNYNFKINNITITDAIEKGSKPTITFESSNNLGLTVEYIVIDGVGYNVTLINDNYYEVELTKLPTLEYGKFHLDISEVVLSNLKAFYLNQDYEANTLTYNVLKQSALVKNIEITEKDKDNLAVYYELEDHDSTLLNLSAVLVDSTGKVIDTKKDITPGADLTLSHANNNDGLYKVKFLADLNLGTERHTYPQENIGEAEILTQTDIYIISSSVSKIYPTKGEPKFTVTYKLFVSDAIKKQYGELAGVTINGLNYDGAAGKDYTNTISFTVPSTSGLFDLTASRVKLRSENYNGYRQEYFSIRDYTTQIDILKDIPSVANFTIKKEDYAHNEATFTFDIVTDNGGFVSGDIKLDNETIPINEGPNEVTFKEITPDTISSLEFYATYDLDTNQLGEDESANYYPNKLIHKQNYGLFDQTNYDSLTLTNGLALSSNNNAYFEKNEDLKIKFNLMGLDSRLSLSISKIVYKDTLYPVTKVDDDYYVILPGFSTAGAKEINISQIILSNGKNLTLPEPLTVALEVLKDPITITDFKYTTLDNAINLTFAYQDLDKSVANPNVNLKVQIYDEDHNLLKEEPFSAKITIPKSDSINRYYVEIYASYDRDLKLYTDNYYPDMKIFDEVISLENNYLDLKEITDINLYQELNGETLLLDEVSLSDLQANLPSYFAEISFQNMPNIRAQIKQVINEKGKLILVLDLKNVVLNGEKNDELRIEFGPLNEEGIAQNESHPETFEGLINRLKLHPDGTFNLDHDYDASSYQSETTSLTDITFTGTLNGNGYTIKNLNKQLFNEVTGTIKNVVFEDVNVTTGTKGLIAKTASHATISNVLVNGFTKTAGRDDGSGVLFGTAENGTLIEKTRVKGMQINNNAYQNIYGGLVGYLRGSTIKNCYVIGTIQSGWWGLGGLVGYFDSSSLIENCYTKVTLNESFKDPKNSGFAGYGEGTLRNVVSLSTGNVSGYTIASSNFTAENVYQMTESTIKKLDQEGIYDISKTALTQEFFENQALFSADIWDFNDISFDNLPTLNFEFNDGLDNKAKEDSTYDPNKRILYYNLGVLAPFYDSSKIIQSGAIIPEDHLLNKSEIKHLVPVDESGNIVTYLTTDNLNKITKIKLVFKNNTKITYDVRYDNTYNMIASYRLSDLKIDYTFNHYVIDSNSQLVNNLTNYLAKLTYEDNLDVLSGTSDSRIYRDYYYEVTKPHLKEFVLKYLANSNYTNTSYNEVIDDYLEREIKKDHQLEKLLYAYNYFNRFYSISIDGIMLNDFILFDMQGFNSNLTPSNIASMFLSDAKNINTNETNNTYNRIFAKYTTLDNIPAFLEYLVTEFSDKAPDRWYAEAFKGYLVEINIDDRPDIEYTLWDHIKTPDVNTKVNWFNYCLPILTLPENAAYIISTPTQFIIGSQRTYISDPFDPDQHESLVARIASYTSRMKTYYTTAAHILEDESLFNNTHTIQIDKRYTYDLNGILTFQNPYSTEEPFHKNFNEVLGQWAYNDYNAATANGAQIIWRVEGLMDGDLTKQEYTYHTWSHETAHNMDSRIFLKNNGRRFDAGGEDYADGNLTQSFGENDIVMNFSKKYPDGTNIGSNLDPSRIDSPTKIADFYQKLFQTIYIVDYLEGQAFLKLSPAEQASIAVQASYPNLTKYELPGQEYLQNKFTVYQTIEASKFADMHLETIDDLYDNALVIFPGVIYSTYTDNRYGGEGINKVHWYQPHNDYGRPDSYSIKWFAYEMLGYAGYDEGYIAYYSNINSTSKELVDGDGKSFTANYKSDLTALRDITKDPTMTFETYKHNRFQEVADNLDKINIINVNDTFKRFYEALKKDAAYVAEVEKQAWEKYPSTNETDTKARNNLISKARAYTNSTALRKEIFYALKNGTNDFLQDVYSETKTQEVTDFVIPESVNLNLTEEPILNEEIIMENEIMESNSDVSSSNLPEENNQSSHDTLEQPEIDQSSKESLIPEDAIPNPEKKEEPSNEPSLNN